MVQKCLLLKLILDLSDNSGEKLFSHSLLFLVNIYRQKWVPEKALGFGQLVPYTYRCDSCSYKNCICVIVAEINVKIVI